jgi:hypothetical protein
MATIIERRDRRVDGAPGYARGGLWTIANIVSFIVSFVVGVLLLGIVLVFFKANRSNDIVDFILDVGRVFAGPFDNIFSPGGHRLNVAVNWGLAALVYGLLGGWIANHLRR